MTTERNTFNVNIYKELKHKIHLTF